MISLSNELADHLDRFSARQRRDYEQFRSALLDCLLLKKTPEETIAVSAETFRCPIILTTNAYRVLVLNDCGYKVNDPVWKMAEETGYCGAESVEHFESEGITRQVLSNDDPFILNQGIADKIPRILHKVYTFGRVGAYIGIFQMDREFTVLDLIECDLLCSVLSVMFERDPAALRLELSIKDSIVSDLISGDIGSATLLNDRLHAARWTIDGPFRCVLITPEHASDGIDNADYLIEQIKTKVPRSQVIRVEEGLLLLIHHEKDSAQKLSEWLIETASGYGLYLNASGLFDDLINLKDYYALCVKMHRTAKRLHMTDRLTLFEDIAPEMITEKLDRSECLTFRQNEYALLHAYDTRHDTDYVKTLLQFIECGCNITEASKRLYVHRNTLARRLERIHEICGINTSDGKALIHFYLSVRMQK